MVHQKYSLDEGYTVRKRFGLSKWRILSIVLVGLIGAALIAHFITHRSKHTTSASEAMTTQTSSATVPNPKPDPSSQKPISTSEASQLVTNFYHQYIAAAPQKSAKAAQEKLVQQYGTSKLSAYYSPGAGRSYPVDPVLCAQAAPHRISVINVTSDSSSAAGTVSETYSTGPINIGFKVVKQSGSLKIDSIACSPPLVAGAG